MSTVGDCIAVVVMVGVMACLLAFAGCQEGKVLKEKEAVKAGVGRYVIDENRKVTFEWVTK